MNPYKILQVDPDAEQEVVEAAYKRLASKYHPDKNPSASATSRMQEINAAYEILKDSCRRREYDDSRAESAQSEAQPAKARSTAPQAPSREKASKGSFRNIVWGAAATAIVIYIPWLGLIAFCVWAAVWLLRRPGAGPYLQKAASLIGRTVGVALILGLSVWIRQCVQTQRAEKDQERELQKLTMEGLLTAQLGAFDAGCIQEVSISTPMLAQAYCSYLSQSLRTSFDYKEFNATSTSEYKDEFYTRFKAAIPGEKTQSTCFERVRPKPVPPPASPPAKATRRKPNAVPGDTGDTSLKAFMEGL